MVKISGNDPFFIQARYKTETGDGAYNLLLGMLEVNPTKIYWFCAEFNGLNLIIPFQEAAIGDFVGIRTMDARS